MEVVDKVPEQVKENIHEQALEKLARREKRAYHVGMHTANMKIMGEVRKTIIPSMNLYISDVTNKGVISSHIEYRISYNNTTMPFGHVYGQSGCLCLGNIPVPPFVDPHNLMDPLETLFLYNDRNINHGGAKLPITPEQDRAVRRLATCYNEVGYYDLTSDEQRTLEFMYPGLDEGDLTELLQRDEYLIEHVQNLAANFAAAGNGNFELGIGLAELVRDLNDGELPDNLTDEANRQLQITAIAHRNEFPVIELNVTTRIGEDVRRPVNEPFRPTELVTKVAGKYIVVTR